jgi:hypothetical protein
MLLLALLCCTSLAWADPPVPDDFAYGCSLPVTDENGLYAVDLELSVLSKLQRKDLSDVQVFNGAGLPVPHALRRLDPPRDPVRRPIPFFPLPSHPHPQTQDLSVSVQRQTDGSIFTLKTEHTQSTTASDRSYLLDLSGLNTPPTQLELQWPAGTGTTFYTISLLESGDLAHWRPLGDKVVLADLDYNGGRVSRRVIDLAGQTLPYLRLDCQDARQPLQLSAVLGVHGAVRTAEQWRWHRLENQQVSKQSERWVIEYQLRGGLRVSAFDLAFPLGNSLARATIESRPAADAPWRRVGQGVFYRLDIQGKQLFSPFIPCTPTTDRWWRLTLAAGDSGLIGKDQLPQLKLGWMPEELLFLGRGAGPYTLAFGSARTGNDPSGQASLVLTALQQSASESRMVKIKAGPVHPLGGEQALRPKPAPLPWQRLLLWAVLIGGVGLLAIMARSIYREMQSKHN